MKQGYIIGIAGELNSGKDTLASMINYIVAVGTTKAKYEQWLIKRITYDIGFADRITHFADPMKDCLSIMYNIKREYFDDRTYKDDFWYIINERRFTDESQLIGNRYKLITINDLNLDTTLSWWISNYNIAIKLRTIMQYFGTEIGRKLLDDNLWVNATMNKAADVAMTRKICIIPDIRFSNELSAVRGNILYGQDIEIKRNVFDEIKHASETIDFKCSTIIVNNGTKLQLFYKAIKVVQDLFNK